MSEVTDTVPDVLPEDTDLLQEQQGYLFEDELLQLAEKYAQLTTKASQIADQKKTCKATLIKAMKSAGISEGAAELEDGEKIVYTIEETLKTKKVVAK